MNLKKLAASALLAFCALAPAACMAIALPGQDPLAVGRTPGAPVFGLPGETTPTNETPGISQVNKLIKRGLQVVAGVSVAVLVWVGVLYVTSYGDEEKVKKAKKGVIWTILGLVTGLGGWAIIDLINNLTLK